MMNSNSPSSVNSDPARPVESVCHQLGLAILGDNRGVAELAGEVAGHRSVLQVGAVVVVELGRLGELGRRDRVVGGRELRAEHLEVTLGPVARLDGLEGSFELFDRGNRGGIEGQAHGLVPFEVVRVGCSIGYAEFYVEEIGRPPQFSNHPSVSRALASSWCMTRRNRASEVLIGLPLPMELL